MTSPWFGSRADKGGRLGIIAAGVAVWSAAAFASGLATGFWTLVAARVVVGIGEASYVSLAPTIIDDLTPIHRKGKALAVFFLAQPLGAALGFLIGGAIAKPLGWRSAFFFTGGPGVVLALSCLWIAEPPRKLAAAGTRIFDGVRELVAIPLYRRATLGYCLYTAAVGAFSFWAPNFLLERFPGKLDLKTANFWFGLVLVAAGAVSTLLGGWLGDRAVRRLPAPPADAGYDAPAHRAAVNALLRLCAIGMIIAAPLAALAFLATTPVVFFALAFFVEIGLFLSASPLNAAYLRAVPAERRATAIALSVFAIHAFGDLWSPPGLGLLKDALPVTLAMMTVPLTFAAAASAWWPRRREAM